MKMIEVTEKKMHNFSEMLEEMLTIGGKLMSCVEAMKEEGEHSGRHGRYHEDEYEREREREYKPRYSRF